MTEKHTLERDEQALYEAQNLITHTVQDHPAHIKLRRFCTSKSQELALNIVRDWLHLAPHVHLLSVYFHPAEDVVTVDVTYTEEAA